ITTGSGTLSNTNPTISPATVTFTPAVGFSGTITLTLTSDDPDGAGPCPAVSAIRTITVSQAATANAGPNQTVCAGSTVQLAGSIGGSVTGGTWSSSGS